MHNVREKFARPRVAVPRRTGKIGCANGGLGMGGLPARAAIRNFAAMAGTACRAPTNSELRGGLHSEPGPGPNPRENQMRANVKAASARLKFIAADARLNFLARRTRLNLSASFAPTCAALAFAALTCAAVSLAA